MKESKEPTHDYQHISWPEKLTDIDQQLIIRQCELQTEGNPTDAEILGMAVVYTEAKDKSSDRNWIMSLTPEALLDTIDEWSVIIDPINEKNRKTQEGRAYRHQDAKFKKDGTINTAASPDEIPEAMQRWAAFYLQTLRENYQSNVTMPEEETRDTAQGLYDMFESIHPYSDGNGRLGDILWKLIMKSGTKEWPEELPPDIF